ncbi:hypothetical protein, partial [Klebsiella aerogenes]|uniref:hypothetical protein n=1 Tax=Klebsiella aerogenes TaxID=548 RepID=UPI0013D2F030
SMDGEREVGLPIEERNKMGALRRGYQMISDVMRGRGVTPTLNLSGSRNPNAKVAREVSESNSVGSDFRARRQQGGMER